MKNNQHIVWKSSYINTTEFLAIETQNPYTVKGQITGEAMGKPINVSYKLLIDPLWNIQSVFIEVQTDTPFTISLKKNNTNQWLNENGIVLAEFNECIDIDISLTPFTNSLPINRLNLPTGTSKEIDVIYINLPASECKPVKQRYTNLGNGFYKYESLDSGFISTIEVDENGYVINYPGIWQRVFPPENNQAQLNAGEVFSSALLSQKASQELKDKEALYDWLIGGWNLTMFDYKDGNKLKTDGECLFTWILEGRAIQDVWIAPKRSERTSMMSKTNNRYGTTLRFYDASNNLWRIHWFNPVSGAINQLFAKKVGENIVQEGKDGEGNLIRWSFVDIETNSFRWIGERSFDNGKSWKLEAEFLGKRK